jgi:hypothetical protein
MFEFRPTRDKSSEPYNSVRGGRLKSKFTIHERPSGYKATSANGNSELIQFLESLCYLSNKRNDGNYSWWDVDPTKIVTLQNAVMNNFN